MRIASDATRMNTDIRFCDKDLRSKGNFFIVENVIKSGARGPVSRKKISVPYPCRFGPKGQSVFVSSVFPLSLILSKQTHLRIAAAKL
jgi:hypothetical protein